MALRGKLEHIEATTGKRPAPLNVRPLPWPALDAWGMWTDLHSGRSQNGMDATPLSWIDIQAWSQMREHKLTFTEIELIRTIDRAFLTAHVERTKREE